MLPADSATAANQSTSIVSADPAGTCGPHVVVEDPDALFERVRAGGVEITDELHDTDYGSDFALQKGNRWSFGT